MGCILTVISLRLQLDRKVRESLASIDDHKPQIRDIVRGSCEAVLEAAFYLAIALAGAA